MMMRTFDEWTESSWAVKEGRKPWAHRLFVYNSQKWMIWKKCCVLSWLEFRQIVNVTSWLGRVCRLGRHRGCAVQQAHQPRPPCAGSPWMDRAYIYKVRPLMYPWKLNESTRNHPPDPAKTSLLIPLKRRFFDVFASWNSGITKKIAFLWLCKSER